MSGPNDLSQRATAFDGFLYAIVGEDQGGNKVSVVSALARLGLDPWDEASDLSALGVVDAQARLKMLVAKLCDIPALAGNHGAVAQRLVDLLPKTSGRPAGLVGMAPVHPALVRFGPIIAVVVVILLMVYSLATGSAGPDN